MRKYFYDFKINGKPILVPDSGVSISKADIDAPETGRDESGYMHRVILRKGVLTFGFSYAVLTAEEYRYMQDLLTESPTVEVEYVDSHGKKATTKAYCSNHSISLHSSRTPVPDGFGVFPGQLYKNLKFNIIEC